jgi:hypothetical protein
MIAAGVPREMVAGTEERQEKRIELSGLMEVMDGNGCVLRC